MVGLAVMPQGSTRTFGRIQEIGLLHAGRNCFEIEGLLKVWAFL